MLLGPDPRSTQELKIRTLVDWNDSKRVQFFRANEFIPFKTINLERSL
jgi:hypothetical protein